MEIRNSLTNCNVIDSILNQYCSGSQYWYADLSPKRYNSNADNLHRSIYPTDIFQNTINKSFEIKDVIFNNPATIVFWTDGSKTVVKCKGKDSFDPEKGLAMAIVKKVFGNQGNYYNQIKKWLEP